MISVLFSVWGTEQKFLKRGREGMLILTTKRIAFVSKTQMNIEWWKDEVDRQLKDMARSRSAVRASEQYTLERLGRDLQEEDNLNIPLKNVESVSCEEKRWGGELELKFSVDGKTKTWKFAIVKGWTSYPVKDPIGFLDVDWKPWVEAARSYM